MSPPGPFPDVIKAIIVSLPVHLSMWLVWWGGVDLYICSPLWKINMKIFWGGLKPPLAKAPVRYCLQSINIRASVATLIDILEMHCKALWSSFCSSKQQNILFHWVYFGHPISSSNRQTLFILFPSVESTLLVSGICSWTSYLADSSLSNGLSWQKVSALYSFKIISCDSDWWRGRSNRCDLNLLFPECLS